METLEKYLVKFEKITRTPTLEGIKYLLNEFGNPQGETKFIHIAGTNGKGSCTEMISSILIKAGYKVRKIPITTLNKIQRKNKHKRKRNIRQRNIRDTRKNNDKNR